MGLHLSQLLSKSALWIVLTHSAQLSFDLFLHSVLHPLHFANRMLKMTSDSSVRNCEIRINSLAICLFNFLELDRICGNCLMALIKAFYETRVASPSFTVSLVWSYQVHNCPSFASTSSPHQPGLHPLAWPIPAVRQCFHQWRLFFGWWSSGISGNPWRCT